MNPELDIYEKIDRFLNNRMESGERRAFESEMHRNPELKETVEAQRIANMIVLDQGMVDLKAQMQRDMSGSSSSGSGFSAITVAVIGAVMVSAGVAAFLLTSSPSSEKSSPEKNNSEVVSGSTAPSDQNTTTENISGNNTPRVQKNNETISTVEPVSAPEEVVPPVTTPSSQQHSTTPSPENTPSQNKTNLCDSYSITARIDTYDPCPESTGQIEIYEVKNGKAPYTFSFQNQPFEKYTIFDNLALGSYTVTVRDANGCTKLFKATVKRNIDCIKNIAPPQSTSQYLKGDNYTFEPDVDREWNIPLSLEKNATLKIISRSGVTVFENKITYGSGFAWNGQTPAGINVEEGYYVYTLQYEDGSIEKGTLTILR